MLTITEGLAEIKTIAKRIEKKNEFVRSYAVRPNVVVDPLAADGGAPAAIQRELQAIGDLEKRLVDIRLAIQKANTETPVTVEGVTKSMSEWLVWRREVAPGRVQRISSLRQGIIASRKTFMERSRQGGVEDVKPEDLIVNVSEQALATEAETIEVILSQLDGQLSLKNATVTIGM